MMTKKRTSALASMKLLIVIPVTGLVFLAISAYKEIPDIPEQKIVSIPVPQSLSASTSSAPLVLAPPPLPPPATSEIVKEEVIEESGADPFVVVEQMPRFPGGDTELLKFIMTHTNYPEVAKENNIQGKVIVRFCVTSKGGVSRISILKGVAPELDQEALRIVETLPAFEPGMQGGTAVPVWYMVPITFTLK